MLQRKLKSKLVPAFLSNFNSMKRFGIIKFWIKICFFLRFKILIFILMLTMSKWRRSVHLIVFWRIGVKTTTHVCIGYIHFRLMYIYERSLNIQVWKVSQRKLFKILCFPCTWWCRNDIRRSFCESNFNRTCIRSYLIKNSFNRSPTLLEKVVKHHSYANQSPDH